MVIENFIRLNYNPNRIMYFYTSISKNMLKFIYK